MRVQAQEFGSWLKDAIQKQEARAPHEEPAFTVAELQVRFDVVHDVFTKLSSVPAPKPPVVKSNTTEDAKEDGEDKAKEKAEAKGDSRSEGEEGGQEDNVGEAEAEKGASAEESEHDEL
jgi:hypoxia up-regulated 1